MTPLTLSPHEVKLALKGEPFLLIRPMVPQPHRVDDDGRWYKMPSGGLSLNCYDSPFGKPGEVFSSHNAEGTEYLTLTHTGTEVKRVQDVTFRDGIALGGLRKDQIEKLWQSQYPDHPWGDNPLAWLARMEVAK